MYLLEIKLPVQDHSVQGPSNLQVARFKKEGFLLPLPTIFSVATTFSCWGVIGTNYI